MKTLGLVLMGVPAFTLCGWLASFLYAQGLLLTAVLVVSFCVGMAILLDAIAEGDGASGSRRGG